MTSDSSHSSDKDWSPSPERSTYRQPPVMEIGIECQSKPPVRLKSASSCPQSHPKMIGVACEEKPPVRLKPVSASTWPPRHMPMDQCSTNSSHASMCSRPTHKKIGIGCADQPPVRLRRASLHPQAHIGIKCQEKPPVRLKSVSACTQPPRNMAKNSVNGVRPEEEPQGSIWFLTQLSHLTVSPTSFSHG